MGNAVLSAASGCPEGGGSDGLPARRLALEVIRAVTENDAYASSCWTKS
ncbi:MAG: hypothetical protein ACLT1X_05105 [Christensenellales bacterium]